MNTYKITFQRANGTEASDNFTEPNEREARKAFKECYRHGDGDGTITSVELLKENAQASKQQELRALEDIRKMVETLGPDSYIATAFAECFGIAEWNIENDGADSLKERLQLAEEKISQGAEAAARHRQLEAENEAVKAKLDGEQQNRWDAEQKIMELGVRLTNAELRAEAAEETVTQLKARLYDYITAGA